MSISQSAISPLTVIIYLGTVQGQLELKWQQKVDLIKSCVCRPQCNKRMYCNCNLPRDVCVQEFNVIVGPSENYIEK